MKVFQGLLLLTAVSSLVACAKSADVGTPEQNTSGLCGSQTVLDYNDVILKCDYFLTEDDVRTCKSKANGFLAKYPNMSCKAQRDGKEQTVDTSEIRKIVEKITAAGY